MTALETFLAALESGTDTEIMEAFAPLADELETALVQIEVAIE
jgi:hypothetical protein